MKKFIIAAIAVFALASCTGNKYGCYKRGRCVDAEKKETFQQEKKKAIA